MRTTASDDKDFIDSIIDRTVLESAIDFITNRFEAEEVYGKEVMEIWALENGFVREDKVEELEEEVSSLNDEVFNLKDEIQRLQNDINELNE